MQGTASLLFQLQVSEKATVTVHVLKRQIHLDSVFAAHLHNLSSLVVKT